MVNRSAPARSSLLGKTLSLEAEILLCCAHVGEDAQRTARCRQLLQEKVDWERLIALAQRHSLTPLLFWQLRDFDPATVPAARMAELRGRFHENAARNLILGQALLEITRALEAAGIESVPYKGPALAVFAYGNLSLRRFGDLDIIVRKEDVARAKVVLSGEGYNPYRPLTDAQETALMRTQHGLAFIHEREKIILELHWDVAGKRFSSQYNPAEAWRRLETVRILNGAVNTLSVEDTLLALCVHGSKHQWERLAWVCDIGELIASHEEIDWESTLKWAKASGSWRMLALGLLLALEMFEAPLPESLKQEVISDEAVRHLAARIAGDSFTESIIHPTLLKTLAYNYHVRERMRDRLGYCGFIFSPTDADLASVSFPAPLGFLYYLLRPIRMVYKTGKSPTAHKVQDSAN